MERKCVREDPSEGGNVKNRIAHRIHNITAYARVLSDIFSLQWDIKKFLLLWHKCDQLQEVQEHGNDSEHEMKEISTRFVNVRRNDANDRRHQRKSENEGYFCRNISY